MRGPFAQVGMGLDFGVLTLSYLALAFAGVAAALWLVMVALSGGRGPRLPAVRRLPRFVGPLLGSAAAVLWAACAWGYADGGSRSEVFRAVLPFAVAITVAALCVAAGPARGSRAGADGG